MPDNDTTGTNSAPAGSTDNTPIQPPAAPAAPVPPQHTVGTPPAAPSTPPPSGDIDADNLARRYDTERGRFMQYVSSVNEWIGRMLQREAELEHRLQDQVQVNATVMARLEALQTEVEALPQLREQATLADQLEAQLDRMRQIANFPEVVNRTQVTTRQLEDGSTVEERDNPLMGVLMSSTLTGEQFLQHLQGVVQQLGGVPSNTQPQAPTAPPEQGATPPPAPPSGQTEIQDRIRQLYNEGRYQEAEDLLVERAQLMEG